MLSAYAMPPSALGSQTPRRSLLLASCYRTTGPSYIRTKPGLRPLFGLLIAVLDDSTGMCHPRQILRCRRYAYAVSSSTRHKTLPQRPRLLTIVPVATFRALSLSFIKPRGSLASSAFTTAIRHITVYPSRPTGPFSQAPERTPALSCLFRLSSLPTTQSLRDPHPSRSMGVNAASEHDITTAQWRYCHK